MKKGRAMQTSFFKDQHKSFTLYLLKLSLIPNWHISSLWRFSRIFVRTDINKISTSVSPVETNSFLNPFLAQFFQWRMILWSASSMPQFEISSSAIMFSVFASIESLFLITKYFWNIVVSKHTCRWFLLSLFVEKILLKSPGISVSSLNVSWKQVPCLIGYFALNCS